MSMYISPNTEVHLIKSGQHGGTKIELKSIDNFSGPNFVIDYRTAGIATATGLDRDSLSYILFTPTAVGETITRFTRTATSEDSLVRVQVHDGYKKVWFAHSNATLYNDEDNFIPTIYARFEDSSLAPGLTSVGDVTGHFGFYETVGLDTFLRPNINIYSTEWNKVEVDESGRLTARVHGANPVDVELFVNHLNDPVAKVVLTGGSITAGNITWLKDGSGFTEPPIVRLFGGSGAGADLRPVMSGTDVTGLTIAKAGSGYANGEEVTVVFTRLTSDDAYFICATPTGAGNSIVSANLTFVRGGNYDAPPVVKVVGGGGSGAVLTPVMSGSSVASLTIVTAGSGYTTAPQIVIKPSDQVLPVLVKERLDDIQQLVVKKFNSPAGTGPKMELLFISEGFESEADFDYVVTKLKDRLFSDVHEPYGTLRDQIQIYTAFFQEPEAGITCKSQLAVGVALQNGANAPTGKSEGLPVPPNPDVIVYVGAWTYRELVLKVGLPTHNSPANHGAALTAWSTLGANATTLPSGLFDYWKARRHTCYAQHKNTPLGFSCGNSWAKERRGMSGPTPHNMWYFNESTRSVVVDDRREAAKMGGMSAFMDRFLKSLKMVGKVPGDPEYHIGGRWASDGPNYGLVGVICNETIHGGTNSGYIFGSNVGTMQCFSISQIGTSQKYKNGPNHVSALDTGRDFTQGAGTFAHELGHGAVFEFIDEYEDDDNEGHYVMELTNALSESKRRDMESEMKGVDKSPNTTYFARLEHPNNTIGKDIDSSRIKWDFHRMDVVSVLTSAAINATSGVNKRIEVMVPLAEAAKWETIKTEGRNIYLTRRVLNPHHPRKKALRLGRRLPMTILSIDAGTGKITLQGDEMDHAGDFEAGSYIYTPRLSGGKLASVTIVNAGAGYDKEPEIEIDGSRGAKSKVRIGVAGGALDAGNIKYKTYGTEFYTQPVVKVIPKGSNAPTTPAVVTASLDFSYTGVTYITITEGGSNYTSAPAVQINGGGSGGGAPTSVAVATAVLSDLTLTDVTLTDGGLGNYVDKVEIQIVDATGYGAKGYIQTNKNNTNGEINGVQMESTGCNYSASPTVSIVGAGGTGGVISPIINAQGSITGFSVTNHGSGYVDTFETGGLYLVTKHATGTGAVISLKANNGGSVTGHTIENGGSGYTTGALTVLGLYVPNKAPEATPTTVAITAVNGSGAITAITVTPSGTYWNQEVPLTGVVYDKDGVDMGAKFAFTVNPSTKLITDIKIVNPGSGYVAANGPYKLHIMGGVKFKLAGGGKADIVISKRVAGVLVTNRGEGYKTQPTVVFTGGGASRQAQAEAEIDYYGRMIDPPVMHAILASKAPFSPKGLGACNTNVQAIGYPTGITAPGYVSPAYAPYTVGIYEGAATFNCKAYRPTGISIYRGADNDTHIAKLGYHRFNFPCRVQMVSLLDPKYLPKVDDVIQDEYRKL